MKYLTTVVRGLPHGTTSKDVENDFNLSIDSDSPCVAGPTVKELQGNTCSTTVTFRSEKHDKKRNCDSLRDHFNRSHFRGSSSTISVTDGFYGLTPLSGEVNAPIHIYHVHGLGGHAFNTWASDLRHGNIDTLRAWPRDFLPRRLQNENINARVYTLGYNANMMRDAAPDATINSAAQDLLASLYGDRQHNAPQEIYFVCHSLGGLILCQALVMALFQDDNYDNKQEYQDLFWKGDECLVKGVVFMGTPFRGSGQASLFTPFIRAIRQVNLISAVNDNFLKSLNSDQPVEVTTIVQRFQRIVQAMEIKLLICCESRPVVGSSLTTSRHSAVATFGQTALIIGINDDHRGMTKFDDPNHADYSNLENHIIKMIRPLASRPTSSLEGTDQQRTTSPRHDHFGVPVSSSPQHENTGSKQSPAISPPGPSQTIHYYNYFGNNSHSVEEPHSSTDNHGPSAAYDMSGMYQELQGAQILHGNTSIQRQQTYPQRPFDRVNQFHDRKGPTTSRPQTATETIKRGTSPARRSTVASALTRNEDDDPFNRLRLFDTVIIVDDTGSMIKAAKESEPEGQDRWTAMKVALQHLTEVAASKDPDGIDIRFLKSRDLDADNITNADRVMDILAQVDMFDDRRGGGTEFKDHLEQEIEPRLEQYHAFREQEKKYKEDLRRLSGDPVRRRNLVRPKAPNKLNLIVTTDGQADDRQEVEDYIIEAARQLDEMKAPAAQIGIQFVQIGEDESARKYLRRLDNELANQDPPVRDIVDTTPCDSQLFHGADFEAVLEQVLLGAITKDIDKRNT